MRWRWVRGEIGGLTVAIAGSFVDCKFGIGWVHRRSLTHGRDDAGDDDGPDGRSENKWRLSWSKGRPFN
jgi:hypothetical protein